MENQTTAPEVQSEQPIDVVQDNTATTEAVSNQEINFKDLIPEEFKEDKLEVFQGNSSNLKEYLSSIKFKETDRIVFFLDSHGHGHGCPLIEELQAIKDMNFVRKPIIILDDVRIIRDCVWSDNRYTGSNFEDILKGKLTDIDPEYKFSYLDGHIEEDCLMASVYCLNV